MECDGYALYVSSNEDSIHQLYLEHKSIYEIQRNSDGRFETRNHFFRTATSPPDALKTWQQILDSCDHLKREFCDRVRQDRVRGRQ
jgi:hypothetical protein